MTVVPRAKNLVVITLVVLTSLLLFGQAVNFARIQGRITDSTGAALPGATISMTQTATGLVRTTTSNAEGNYALPNLPVGPYQLRVTAKGFSDYLQKGIVLQVAQSPSIDVVLKVGAISETVEVTAVTSMVETHDNAISAVIDNSRIMELPLQGRNAPDLIMLTGAAANPTLTSNDILSSKNYGNGNRGQSQAISVAGGQENSNNFLLDGSDNNDAFSNVNSPYPFPDALQEFSVQQTGGSARYGVQAGAAVNAVTKSGTNSWHGNVFEFIRNPQFNAKHVQFSPPVAGFRDDTDKRNQFGGTIGGPIKKDKIMFFAGYQATRESSSVNPISVFLPTAAALQGDFSTMFASPCTAKTLKSYNGVTITANRLAPVLFNPQSLALLKYVPLATDPCGKASFSYPNLWSEDQGVAKVDFNFSSEHTLFTRYFATDGRAPVPYDPANILAQGQTASQFSRYQTLAIGDNYTFSPTFTNSLHLTGTRLAINRGPASGMINPATIGIQSPSPISSGMVLSVAGGYFTTGGGSQMPGHFINNLLQVADDLDMVRGKHQIAFGVNLLKKQLNYLSTFQSNGQFTFNTKNQTGDNLVDFLLGWPSTYAQGNPEAENWRMTYIGLYLHDNIKLKPNLTLNVGARWEPYLPSADVLHRGSHFDLDNFLNNVHSTVFPNAPAGLLYCGDPGVPCAFANRKLGLFSPRVGLIWDPTKKGTTTVRAGYGLFYDSPEMYYFDRYADNSPYGSGVSFTPKVTSGASITNPYAGQSGVPAFPLPFPTPGSANAYFPTNGVYINNDFDVHPMYVQSWNFGIEHQFGPWLASARYLGSKTTHVWVAYEANPGLNVNTVATPPASSGGTGCTAGQAASTSNTNCRRALVVANPAAGQYYSNMTSLWDGANANYNAMLLSVQRRFTQSFTLMANYTWAHCISDQDFTGELTNSRPDLFVSPITSPDFSALSGDRGNCGFDVRHQINASVVFSSPAFTGRAARILLGNWQLAPMVRYRTGLPFSVLTGVDTSMTGTTTSFKDRPNLVGDPFSGTCSNGASVGTRNCWLNNTAFAVPANGTFGNVARNAYYGPTGFNFDAAISRMFKVNESKQVQLRLETFNVLNHPNLGNPVTGMNSSNFDKIQGQSGDSRILQGAVKFIF